MHEAVASAARRLTLNLADCDVGLTKVEKLEKLQKQFESLEEDLLVSRIAEKSLPADFPSDQAAKILSEFSKIQVDSGPFYLAVFSKNTETDIRRVHSKNAKIHSSFLLYAETAARLAGYQGDSPATYWLNRIIPQGQAERLDLRDASANECQRLINEAGNGSDEVEANALALNADGSAAREKPTVAKLDVLRINEWIEDQCYMNETLAKQLKVSVRTISSIRNNRKSHGRPVLTKLANLMSCDLVDLWLE